MKVKGSATVEMIYIMPIIFLAFTAVLYIGFYFHDKAVLQGITYEATIIGSQNYRSAADVQETEIKEFLYEKSEARFLFFDDIEIEIDETKEDITVQTQAQKHNMVIASEDTLSLVIPESDIRQWMNLQEGAEEIITNVWEVMTDAE